MIRIFSLSGGMDHTVLRAILVADLIGFVSWLAVSLLIGLGARAWQRRRKKKQPSPGIGLADLAADPEICWHCTVCHKPYGHKPQANRCIDNGRYCDACRAETHR